MTSANIIPYYITINGNILWYYISTDHAYLLRQQFNYQIIQSTTIINTCSPKK